MRTAPRWAAERFVLCSWGASTAGHDGLSHLCRPCPRRQAQAVQAAGREQGHREQRERRTLGPTRTKAAAEP